uniref:Uncharacterized protein n=1 Tax=Clostera anachoreta granulovirus TaxID=283675 RepID=Q0VHB5_9BBAC|nr:unknown [Clostera anachoreta granulovirus]
MIVQRARTSFSRNHDTSDRTVPRNVPTKFSLECQHTLRVSDTSLQSSISIRRLRGQVGIRRTQCYRHHTHATSSATRDRGGVQPIC